MGCLRVDANASCMWVSIYNIWYARTLVSIVDRSQLFMYGKASNAKVQRACTMARRWRFIPSRHIEREQRLVCSILFVLAARQFIFQVYIQNKFSWCVSCACLQTASHGPGHHPLDIGISRRDICMHVWCVHYTVLLIYNIEIHI